MKHIASIKGFDLRWFRRQGLTIIFSAVYVLMSLLIVEQGRTIDSQRVLIKQLFHDSIELTAFKVKQVQEHSQEQR